MPELSFKARVLPCGSGALLNDPFSFKVFHLSVSLRAHRDFPESN